MICDLVCVCEKSDISALVCVCLEGVKVLGLSFISFQLLAPPASAFNVPSSVIVRFSPTFIVPKAVGDAIGYFSLISLVL